MSAPAIHYREQANAWQERAAILPPTTHNEGSNGRSPKGARSSPPTMSGSVELRKNI